ncbi:hypothetical protein ABEB36_009962 [Hypothenemus hampei]|uniref:Uncharacterized protein n=1 Tax=Hypothenemus hampei TaxID=57062 RepID=A0ABD1EL06_HYPHA
MARKTGCLKFKMKRGSIQTLDVRIKETDALRYFLETSNWFLFQKDPKDDSTYHRRSIDH